MGREMGRLFVLLGTSSSSGVGALVWRLRTMSLLNSGRAPEIR